MTKKQWILLVSVLGVFSVFIFCAPLIFTLPGKFDFTQTGQIGDTISGTMSPFIAIVTAFLTFIAFYVQYKANENQKELLEKQEKEIKAQKREQLVSQFENELLQYIKAHRDNVSSLTTSTKENNKKIIVTGQDFLVTVMEMIHETYKQLKNALPSKSDYDLIRAAYIFMYYGDTLWNNLEIKNRYSEYVNKETISAIKNIKSEMRISQDLYKYGFGIQLSMVYRNLYNAYKYIKSVEIDDDFNGEKYKYGKKIRSNISNIEQLLLFYNIITPLGDVWANENIVIEYKLFKNVPLQLAIAYSPVGWMQEQYFISDDEIKSYFEFYE